ncbi:hypothetical protein ACFX1Q_035276 [Malus domestica]
MGLHKTPSPKDEPGTKPFPDIFDGLESLAGGLIPDPAFGLGGREAVGPDVASQIHRVAVGVIPMFTTCEGILVVALPALPPMFDMLEFCG